MEPLAAAGQRKGLQADVIDEFAHLMGDLTQLLKRHALAWVEIEHDARRRPPLSVDETPLRHVHFQGRLLRDPGQPLDGVDHRISSAPRLVHDRGAIQPVRRRGRQLLFEERRLVDPVGPAFARHGTTRDVGQHRFSDVDVVVEDLSLRCPGRRVQHLVRVGQLHPVITVHHITVLPNGDAVASRT